LSTSSFCRVFLITLGAAAAFTLVTLAPVAAQDEPAVSISYLVTPLVSDVTGLAPTIDKNLANPWGLSRSGSSPWWVSDNDTGVSTLYDGSGNIIPLVVTIPPAAGTGKGKPTGTIFHPTLNAFVFCTGDGTLSEWTGGTAAVIKVNNMATASYQGMAVALRAGLAVMYVANSRGGIEAYDTHFTRVSLGTTAFEDSTIPTTYKPYNVQALGSFLWVTWSGPSGGFVDKFDANGVLQGRLQTGSFNAPWGIAHAPAQFGKFSNAVLVGNLGSGLIGAYNPGNGKFLGFLQDKTAKNIVIQDLWAISFGNGGMAGPTTSLYFAAGIRGYSAGLFGTITAN
jgi:uncharacterized protein (TIGR03118 family)